MRKTAQEIIDELLERSDNGEQVDALPAIGNWLGGVSMSISALEKALDAALALVKPESVPDDIRFGLELCRTVISLELEDRDSLGITQQDILDCKDQIIEYNTILGYIKKIRLAIQEWKSS